MAFAVDIVTTIILIPWCGIIMMSVMMVAAGGFRDKLSSIFTAMLLMGYPVILFAVYKLLDIQYFGIQADTCLITFGAVIGIIFFLYGLPKMIFNLLTGIPNSGYFTGTSAVYLDGSRIRKADAKSFEVVKQDSRYAKDKLYVFYNGQIVEGANPKKFNPVKDNTNKAKPDSVPLFWKDETNVFYQNKKINQAESKTFQHVHSFYGRDAHHVYYYNQILEHAQPETFKLVSVNVAADASSVFIINTRSETQVDIESFEVVKNDFVDFFKDKCNIYLVIYNNRKGSLVKVEEADIETFIMLEQNYAQDKNHVYYFGYNAQNRQELVRLDEANPATFKVRFEPGNKSDAQDGNRFYLRGEIMNLRST